MGTFNGKEEGTFILLRAAETGKKCGNGEEGVAWLNAAGVSIVKGSLWVAYYFATGGRAQQTVVGQSPLDRVFYTVCRIFRIRLPQCPFRLFISRCLSFFFLSFFLSFSTRCLLRPFARLETSLSRRTSDLKPRNFVPSKWGISSLVSL